MDEQKAYTQVETMGVLKIRSRNTLAKLIKQGKLVAIRAGERRILIPAWSIEEFLQGKKA